MKLYKREYVLLLSFILINIFTTSREKYGYPLYTSVISENINNFRGILKVSIDRYEFFSVGKPPLALIAQFLSAKLFGINNIGILLPSILSLALTSVLIRKITTNLLQDIEPLIPHALFLTSPLAIILARINLTDSIFILLTTSAIHLTLTYISKPNFKKLYLLLFILLLMGFTKFYMGVYLLPVILSLILLDKVIKMKEKIKLSLLLPLTYLTSPVLWALLYTSWRNKPFLGGTGDSNPFNLIFLSQGLGRYLKNINISIKENFAIMPDLMAYPKYNTGYLKFIYEPYLSQSGYLLIFPLAVAIILVLKRKTTENKTKIITLTTLWFLSALSIVSLAKGPVCCTHPYYTSYMLPSMIIAATLLIYLTNKKYLIPLLGVNLIVNYKIIYNQEKYMLNIFLTLSIILLIIILFKKRNNLTILLLIIIPQILVSTYTINSVTLSERFGDPLAGIYGKNDGKSKIVDVSLDSNIILKNVGQDSAQVEKVSPSLKKYIKNDYMWGGATLRAYIASSLSLATNKAILTYGGETGSESTIKLEDFKNLVKEKKLCYLTINSRDVILLSSLHNISYYSEDAKKIARYAITEGQRVPLPEKENPPALFNLCETGESETID